MRQNGTDPVLVEVCLCCGETEIEASKPVTICARCADIVEFGYPSFPAFRLHQPYEYDDDLIQDE